MPMPKSTPVPLPDLFAPPPEPQAPAVVVQDAPVVAVEAVGEEVARLQAWDFRGYDMGDERQRAVVEDLLRQPLARVK